MEPPRWARVKELFHSALTVEPDRRGAYLAEACASDAEPGALRAEVERLIAAHSQAGSFIDRPPIHTLEEQDRMMSMTGRDVGRYRIGRLIGAGGMGQVYAARDQELGREVAVKIATTGDSDSQLRLRREAQHASRLNHPYICTIHEVGTIDGQSFIVMELVEGPTLADRLARGPIGTTEALPIVRQLVEALDAAHAQGLVHRDLKPANVKLRPDGTIKVLDFGLAKVVSRAGGEQTGLRTSAPVTEPGMVLGTAAYMAPEQVRGEPVDKRADIWAFGCVLYEMLTGERPFGRDNVADTLAAVLTTEPAWEKVPAPFRLLVRRCLERDPARRLRDIGDALALVDVQSPRDRPVSGMRWRERSAWLAGTAAIVAAVLATAWYWRPVAPVIDQIRFEIRPPEGYALVPFIFAPSPDGRSVAFLASNRQTERRSLWLYSIASGVSRQVAELEAVIGSVPFWSPDGRFVAIYGDGKLRSVDVNSGAIQTVCEMPGRMAAAAGSWNRDDVIVFAASGPDGNEGLMRVPASGGTPVLVTRTNRSREVGHGNPIFLPDGRHFLYQSMTSRGAGNVRVASLDVGPDAQQDPPVLELASGRALFAATPDGRAGHVLFMRQGKLMSQTFDINRLQPVGEATVVPNQPSNEIASREFAPSPTILVYRRLIQPNGTLTWVDRRGREESVLGGAVLTGPDFPRFSPDGRHLALVLGGDVWIQDLGGRPPLRLTFNGSSLAPLWTPDGRRVVFETLERLESIAADGSEQTPTPASGNGHYHAHGWSSDGTALIAVRFVGPVPHIVSITPGGDDNFQPLVPSFGRTGENGVALSPDGRWLAYASDATGREEVWVQAYPGPGPPIRVSAAGGVEPVWARSGRELFYREGPRMMSVKVQSSSTAFEAQPAVPLFAGTYLRNGQPPSYDVAADGRFLMIKPSGETDAPIAAIVNWSGASGGQ